MEPLFEVQGVMTEEVLRKAYRVNAKRTRTRVTLEYAFFGGMFFITLALGFFLLYMGDWSGLLYPLCVAFLAVIPPLIQKLAEKTMVTSSQDILRLPYTLRFYPEEYIDYSPRGEWHTAYAALYAVRETDDLLLLYQTKFKFTIIDKRGFTRGTPEDLVRFLHADGRFSCQRLSM